VALFQTANVTAMFPSPDRRQTHQQNTLHGTDVRGPPRNLLHNDFQSPIMKPNLRETKDPFPLKPRRPVEGKTSWSSAQWRRVPSSQTGTGCYPAHPCWSAPASCQSRMGVALLGFLVPGLSVFGLAPLPGWPPLSGCPPMSGLTPVVPVRYKAKAYSVTSLCQARSMTRYNTTMSSTPPPSWTGCDRPSATLSDPIILSRPKKAEPRSNANRDVPEETIEEEREPHARSRACRFKCRHPSLGRR
jgi:hypothetical protein